MSNVTDYKRDSMQTVLGSSVTNIDDLEKLYLAAAGATSLDVNKAWYEVFVLNGSSSLNWNKAANEMLIALGATGTNLADNWAWFWIANGGVIGSGLLVEDTFTDTNGTAVASHTPDTDIEGGGWILDAGGFTIQSNALLPSNPTSTDACRIDAGVSDGVITISGTSSYSGTNRYANNYVRVHENSGSTLGYAVYVSSGFLTDNLVIYGYSEAAVMDAVAVTEIAKVDNIPWTLVVTVSGSTISATISAGASEYTASSALCTSNTSDTHYGLQHWGVGSYTLRSLDDFSIGE